MKKNALTSSQLSFLFDDVAVMEEPPMMQTPVVRAIRVVRPEVFTITNQLDAIGNSVAQKVEMNIKAIQLLKERKATYTADEKATLARYTGWGGAAGAFDRSNNTLGHFSDDLQGLLSDTEMSGAKASVLNAYYTEPSVIKAMWKIIRNMGFNGGKVIDPSAGIGHFTGCMPEDMRANSSVTMVEPDEISAAILNGLYDESSVKVFRRGIETAPLRAGQFDLAISNIPFGQYRVNDARFNAMKLVIHDYFFAKALDLVREGGLVAFITSTGTMDKSSSKLREYIAQRADLVTAIRMPSGAFERLGNTTVATDIIILRKKPMVDDGLSGENFERVMHAKNSHGLGNYGIDYSPNMFFHSHKHLHIGEGKQTSRFGNTGVEIVFKGNLENKLNEIVADLNVEDWYKPASNIPKAVEESLKMAEGVVSGYFLTEADQVAYVDPYGKAELQTHINGKAYSRLYGMVKIRDAALELIELDVALKDTSQARLNLNEKYDRFEKEHGALMLPVNRRLISLDSSAPLLWSLEYYDEEKETHMKSEIFMRSTVGNSVLSETAESVGDAIALSYNKFGKLNLEFMANAMSKSSDEIKGELLRENLAFIDPEDESIVDAEDYLSGNVRVKLNAALDSFARDARFEKNVTMLQTVIPPTIAIEDISIRLGAPWIEPTDIELFVTEHVYANEDVEDTCKVGHSPTLATWSVTARGGLDRDALAISEWGTTRRNFFLLLETGLNQQQPTVKDEVPTDDGEGTKMVVNAVDTTAAREKLEKIQDAFSVWIKSDAERVKKLVRVYNDLFNSIVNRKYDGSHLVVPGLNPLIQLRDAQKDSIWRGVVAGNVLYALAVGGGKTLIQIILAQESKRLGLSKKPVLVVPNHMLEAFAGEYMRAFPKAKILAASKLDMEGDKRRTLMMRMATGNWDAVIITHSSFGKISISKEYVGRFAAMEIGKLENAINEAKGSDVELRAIERTKKSVEAKLKMLAEKANKDDAVLPFDKLGVDLLIVDEADLFKNLWFFTKKTRVAGLSNTASARAFDLFLKSRLIFNKLGTCRRGLVFATATPISNTIAEMFIMQTYLQPETLEAAKVGQFDAWAANFGREVTSIEVAPDGSGYRMHTRFCRFENVPELMRMFREVAEIRTKKMLKLPVPTLVGGKHNIVAVPASEELKAYVALLVERSESIRNGTVKPNEDNMLCVTGDGRRAALDMRNINAAYRDHLGSKVNACVQKVFQHWEDGKDQKLTQLVFSDISTPNAVKFSVYEDMRAKLIAKGVPESEIAFAQDYDTDAKKAVLHRKIRAGRIRVTFGSTELMGFGTNVQDLLVAEHHLDCPWRPRDVEQRDGRIERQGNLNEEIWIYRYVTEGSFDAYMWQTLETKARFIEQIFEGDDVRTIEDVSSTSLSCAEVKALASGNPMVIEKAGIDNEVAKLWSLKSAWRNSQLRMTHDLAMQEDYAKSLAEKIVKTRADGVTSEAASKSIVVGPITSTPCESVAKEMMTIIETAKLLSADSNIRRVKVCDVAGMQLCIETQWGAHRLYVKAQSGSEYEAKIPYGKDKLIAWLSNDVFEIASNSLKDFTMRSNDVKKKITSLTGQIGRAFDYEQRLKEALVRQAEIDRTLGLVNDEAGAGALEVAE